MKEFLFKYPIIIGDSIYTEIQSTLSRHGYFVELSDIEIIDKWVDGYCYGCRTDYYVNFNGDL